MKIAKWLGLTAMLLMLLASVAYAEEEQDMSRDEACAILGDCGDEMVSIAEKMQAQCQSMIVVADKLKTKGMKLKMRGTVWGDQGMIDEGDKMVQDALKMEAEAKRMDEACKIIIDAGKKKKKRSSEMATQGDGAYHNPAGDHSPH